MVLTTRPPGRARAQAGTGVSRHLIRRTHELS